VIAVRISDNDVNSALPAYSKFGSFLTPANSLSNGIKTGKERRVICNVTCCTRVTDLEIR